MTNEEMCQFIAQGESDELIPLLWDKTKNLCYVIADRLYQKNTERAVSCGVEFADVRQECYFAFLTALQAYNKEPQTDKFNTFLHYHMRNTVNSLLGLRTKCKFNEPLNNCLSLDEPLKSTDGDETMLIETISDENAQDGFADVERQDIHRVVRNAVETLSERQKQVIMIHYFEDKPLKVVGEQMGVSYSRVQQIERKAFKELRRIKEIRELYKDFYRRSGFNSFIRCGASSVELAVEFRELLEQNRIITMA